MAHGRTLRLKGGSRDGQIKFIFAGIRVMFPDGEMYRCTDEKDAAGNVVAVIERSASTRRAYHKEG